MMFMKCHRSKLSVWAALCVLVLCWLYIFPVYRLPSDKDIVEEVLGQGKVWTKNQTGIDMYRKLITECCEPREMFALTKENSPIGKVLWYDGELYHSRTVNNDTYPLFVKETPLKLPLKRCAVVGNGGVLKNSGCGRDIDQADFVFRCNLPPLTKEYTADVGTKTHLVTANPSIIEKRYQNLLWSRRTFVESMKAYGSSYVYMSAFSMKPGTEPSLRAYYTLSDAFSNQTVLFANPDFLKSVGKFWKRRGVHAKRLSTGLFLVSLALGLCDEVMVYGFWPFAEDLNQQPVSHHYYDNILPYSGFHAMPEEFLQLWNLHKTGTLRLHIEDLCKKRWKGLGDTLEREKNREKDRCGSGAGVSTARAWRYMAVMGFLTPFLEFREMSGMQSPSIQASQVAALQDSQPDPLLSVACTS